MSYESARPIEAGCLAMIVGSKGVNTGIIVGVLEFSHISPIGQKIWSIDKKLPRYTRFGAPLGITSRAPEEQLLRIDDDSIVRVALLPSEMARTSVSRLFYRVPAA